MLNLLLSLTIFHFIYYTIVLEILFVFIFYKIKTFLTISTLSSYSSALKVCVYIKLIYIQIRHTRICMHTHKHTNSFAYLIITIISFLFLLTNFTSDFRPDFTVSLHIYVIFNRI